MQLAMPSGGHVFDGSNILAVFAEGNPMKFSTKIIEF